MPARFCAFGTQGLKNFDGVKNYTERNLKEEWDSVGNKGKKFAANKK
jgi:hypothetical protein